MTELERDSRRMVESIGLDFDGILSELRAKDPSVGPRDVEWAALNRWVIDALHTGDWKATSWRYLTQAKFLRREGRQFLDVAREAARADLRDAAARGRRLDVPVRISFGRKCCDVCTSDEGRVVDVADELRFPTLPHTACPRGLCWCQYFPAV